MRQHRPEPADRLSRQSRRKHRHIALEIAADKGAAPREAGRIAVGRKAFRKAPARPDSTDIADLLRQFEGIDGSHVDVGNASGEAFGSLPHQIDGGGPQQQEVASARQRGSLEPRRRTARAHAAHAAPDVGSTAICAARDRLWNSHF
jgi:hypothetical protein